MALPTKMYLMFGDPEVDTELVGLCDEFNDKHNAQYDEKKRRIPRKNPILLSSARDISVCPLMEREFVVLDKRAVEFLEAKYGNKE